MTEYFVENLICEFYEKLRTDGEGEAAEQIKKTIDIFHKIHEITSGKKKCDHPLVCSKGYCVICDFHIDFDLN